uniref:SAC3/GANP/THP3 conserved domain-containing protein n=1 Tax=Glossina brevipalpis TaxID=37001 RepID=A0A1A9W0N9_9MUSC
MLNVLNEYLGLVQHGFPFVRDRTRSIRKDIIQQEICCLEAVELMEECVRLLIYCAVRFVAEDTSTFDKKTNAENRIKCLQTLKYMYRDLCLKGIQCPREAEIRSHVIKLNLADSNFLWDLRQMPKHIQKATEKKIRLPSVVLSKMIIIVRLLSWYLNKLRYRIMDVVIKSHKSHNDIDEFIEEVVTRTLTPPKGRKHKIDENTGDMKAIIDKTMDFIKQMDKLEERKKCFHRSYASDTNCTHCDISNDNYLRDMAASRPVIVSNTTTSRYVYCAGKQKTHCAQFEQLRNELPSNLVETPRAENFVCCVLMTKDTWLVLQKDKLIVKPTKQLTEQPPTHAVSLGYK